jgi:hypothetical protein
VRGGARSEPVAPHMPANDPALNGTGSVKNKRPLFADKGAVVGTYGIAGYSPVSHRARSCPLSVRSPALDILALKNEESGIRPPAVTVRLSARGPQWFTSKLTASWSFYRMEHRAENSCFA